MEPNEENKTSMPSVERTKENITRDQILIPPNDVENGVLTSKAPRLDLHAHKTIGGGYDKTSGLGQSRPAGGSLTFKTARRIARESSLLAAIVARREFQMRMISKKWKFEGDLGFRIVHERHHDYGFKVEEGFKNLAYEMENKIMVPWPAQRIGGQTLPPLEPNFSGFCSKYIKDLMILNRPCVEIGRARNGKPIAFGMLDGANILPTHEGIKFLTNPLTQKKDITNIERGSAEYSKVMEALSNEYQIDNLVDETEFVFVQRGIPICGYKYDQIMVRPIFPSTETGFFGYPPSMLENAINMILADLQAMSYELSYFEYGTMIDTVLGIVGNYGDGHIEEIVKHLKDNHSGSGNAHKTPVLPMRTGDDIKTFNLKGSNNDIRFGELLTLITARTCAIFGMNPEEINVINRAGGSGTQFNGNRSAELRENKEEGLFTVRSEVKNCLDDILKEIDPDLCFEWWGLNGEQDDRRKEDIRKDLSAGKISIREARLMDGKEPVPENMEDEDVDVFLNPQAVQLKAQKEQAKMQAEMAANPDGPPGEEGDGDDEGPDFRSEGDDDFESPDFGDDDNDDDFDLESFA